MTADVDTVRLTQYAHGGGCACKIPPGELEDMVRGLTGIAGADLLVGLDDGDDAAAVRIADGLAVLATADFFTPVVDDAYDWGRIAAANALSDVYAMGGRPVLAVNLVGWPRDVLPLGAGRRGAARRPRRRAPRPAARWPAGTASTTPSRSTAWPSPASPTRTACCATTPPSPGCRSPSPSRSASGCSTTGTRRPARCSPRRSRRWSRSTTSRAATPLAHGVRAATDVTGFGLLGHLYKMARASGVTAVVDAAAVPYLDGARASLARRLRPRRHPAQPRLGAPAPRRRASTEDELLLLADAQTTGGLLVAGEIPGGTVIGELVPRGEHVMRVR